MLTHGFVQPPDRATIGREADVMRISRTIAGALVVLATTVSVGAKGPTTRITIVGGDLAAPIEITDPDVVRAFHVWAGAGTYVNRVEATEGFIVDWTSGGVDVPADLPRYEVSFYAQPRGSAAAPNAAPERRVYVVQYCTDASGAGYVHLPGRRDKWYSLNVATIHRGSEGRWFRATAAWQQVAAPLIANRHQ